MDTTQTHYVDPYNTVLRSVQRNVRVSVVDGGRGSVPAQREHSEDDDDAMVELRREQAEIQARMRALEVAERDLRSAAAAEHVAEATSPAAHRSSRHEATSPIADLHARHTAHMSAYQELFDEQQDRSVSASIPRSTPRVQQDTTHSMYTREAYDTQQSRYVKERAENIRTEPFSFDLRERLRKNEVSVRAAAKKRDEHIRERVETENVVEPAGCREGFRATTVPPSTFVNKFEMMQIEDEERKLLNKANAQRARDAALREARAAKPIARKTYISEPLVQREHYVPVADKMQQYHFKARPVPRSVKEPKWDKIAEAEILRKMDVKETARYKLAAYERNTPRMLTEPQHSSRRSTSTPAVPPACVFKPRINKAVPDFTKIQERDMLRKVTKQPAKTTKVEGFKLSTPSYKEQFSIDLDIERDDATRAETRWPYMLPRKPPQRASPRSHSTAAPTRYTKAANMSLLKNSMMIVRRNEKQKADEAEAARRDRRQRTVSLTLKRYETEPANVTAEEEAEEEQWKRNTRAWKAQREQITQRLEKRKPIWLREPEKQSIEAASRAHAEAVSANPPKEEEPSDDEEANKTKPSGKAGSGSDADTPDHAPVAADAAGKSKSKKNKGSDSDDSSSSTSDSYDD